jgi:UDP-N-acetylglucosamine diphosphorylase/glucosamine-1-phosphate N-acetyltransferase
MHLVVFEDAGYKNLLPLVYTRATFDLRCGCDSLLDKIERAVGRTADALFVRRLLAAAVAERQPRAVNQVPSGDDQMWINGRLLLRHRPELETNTAAWDGDTLLAARLEAKAAAALEPNTLQQPSALRAALSACRAVELPDQAALLVEYPWQLVHENDAELVRQLQGAAPKILGRVYPGAHLVNKSAIHLGGESLVKPGAVLDAESGPIHVGENVTVKPNATITGPCYIGNGCVIQPGASIRGGTSIGPMCRVGGEIVSTILHGHSNKQHDGFLGCAYVGEWVNLGADTVNSNLKNTYGPVSVPINGRSVDTGLTFVGAFIGDHAKTGIRVALPTGCVIGFAANVVVSGYAPKFVPSFGWLTDQGLEANDPPRALAVARKVLARRKRSLSEAEEALFLSVVEEARRHEAAE